MKFGSTYYLGEGTTERDKTLQVARGALVYQTTQTGNLWPSSPGEPKYRRVYVRPLLIIAVSYTHLTLPTILRV